MKAELIMLIGYSLAIILLAVGNIITSINLEERIAKLERQSK